MANPIDALIWAWEVAGRHVRVGRHQDRTGPTFNKVGILHTSENSLVRSSAKGVAAWQNTQEEFLDREETKERYSGYHFLVDRHGFVGQCNPADTKANHAGKSFDWKGHPGGGNNHIGVAMVARASRMPYSHQKDDFDNLLMKTAVLLAHINDKYGIPLVRITIEEYKAGKRGWLGHMNVANNPVGRKSDPGEHFPWDELLKEANLQWNRIYRHSVPAYPHQQAEGGKPQAATSGQPSTVSFAAGSVTMSGQTFKASEMKFLKDFASKSLRDKVEAGSLAYATAVIRRLRIELGVEPDITASDLAVRLLNLQGKGRNIG